MKQLPFIISLFLSPTFAFSQSADMSPCPPSSTPGVHVVQPKETLYGISKKYKVTIAQICEWNHISEKDILPRCTSLVVGNTGSSSDAAATRATTVVPDDVPKGYSYVTTPPPSTVTSKAKYVKSTDKTHTIEQGETLEGIATRYGYTSARLLSMNNIASEDNLYIGQVLKVNDCTCETETFETQAQPEGLVSYNITPKSYTNIPTPSNYQWNPQYARVIHIVSQNDATLKETPSSIGALYGLTGAEVMAMNGLRTDDVIPAGQRLTIEDRRQFVSPNSNTNYINTENNNNKPSAPAPTPSQPSSAAPPSVSNSTAMTSEEMQMVDEVNLVRSNPAGYIPYIEQYIQHLKENGDMGNSIASAQELIAELRRTPSLSVLQTMPCLYTAAKKHGDDQRRRGDTDHQGSDGSWPWDRVTRECPNLKDGNENLVGGPSDIRRAVILLLVDDGIEGRGHRKTMLQADWKYIACHKMGTIGTMPNCWVQQFGN